MLKNILQSIMGSSLSHQSAVDIISQWRAKPDHELIFDSSRRDVRQYFEAVDRLRQPPPSSAHRGGFSTELMSIATDRLRHEFVSVLRRHSQAAAPLSTTESSFATDSTAYLFRYEDYVPYEPPNADVIVYLRNIAQMMSSIGNLPDCIQVHRRVRRTFLHSQLQRLRFEDLSSLGLTSRRLTLDELRVKMELWAQACKICVKILFEMENKLCDQIFQELVVVDNNNNSHNYAKDESFVGTVQDFSFGLFSFAETISNQSYETMENVFGVYSAFVWVLPSVNALFSSESGIEIRNKCSEILSKIELHSYRMLHAFESDVLHEKSPFKDNRGSIHQLTTYVMEQIAMIVRNRELLANLIKKAPSLDFGNLAVPQEALGDTSGRNFLKMHVILIVVVLLMNLDSKCRAYQDYSLGQLFMANNVHRVLWTINETNGLREIIGDSYMRKLDENLKAALRNYVRSTCARFEACFADEGLYTTGCFKSRLSKTAVRRRLREFNSAYEEFQASGSSRVVPDLEMRNELRLKLHESLASAYAEFHDKLRRHPETSLMSEMRVGYSTEDFEVLILERLFEEREVVG